MKRVYIPAGETVSYESLVTEQLIVDGCLETVHGVKAKQISGRGIICAGTVYADDICIDEIEAAAIVCARCAAKRIDAPEVYATESLAVSSYLSASYVETGRLTVAICNVNEIKAVEVINLPTRKRSLWGLLIVSALRSLLVRLRLFAEDRPIMDADYTKAAPDVEQQAPEAKAAEAQPEPETGEEPYDEELTRIIALFKLSRKSGYTLRLIPGTPEENAPVFDFANESIVPPAD